MHEEFQIKIDIYIKGELLITKELHRGGAMAEGMECMKKRRNSRRSSKIHPSQTIAIAILKRRTTPEPPFLTAASEQGALGDRIGQILIRAW